MIFFKLQFIRVENKAWHVSSQSSAQGVTWCKRQHAGIVGLSVSPLPWVALSYVSGRDTVERDYGLYLRGSHDQMWFVFNPIDRSNRPPNELYKPVFKLGLGVDDNEWHTVAASFDPANDRVEFFIDGELRAVEIETLNPNYRDSVSTEHGCVLTAVLV